MNKAVLALTGSMMALVIQSPAAAAAITYASTQQLPGTTVMLSITTDGTLGTLFQSNILSYDINIIQGTASARMTPANSVIYFYDELVTGNASTSKLSATAVNLSFLFDNTINGVGFFGIQRGPFYCLQNNGCTNFAGGAIQASVDIDNGFRASLPQSGNVVIATAIAGAVPEPASWAMLLTGFGLVGGAARWRPVLSRPCRKGRSV